MTTSSVSEGTWDVAKAEAMLEAMRAEGTAGDDARVTSFEQIQGGWSRHSYTAHVVDGGRQRAYVVRVAPRGSLLDTDLAEEVRIFDLLDREPLATPTVRGFWQSPDSPFDGPFFVMDRLEGHAINVWRGRDREELAADWEQDRGIANDLVEALAAIHNVAIAEASASITTRDFSATVDRWQGVYENVRLVRDPVVDEAFAWVRSRDPGPVSPTLVHGDFRIGNCLIDDGRITGVLDWELAFIGDPRFDLGYLDLEYYAGRFTKPGSPLLNGVADREWFYERYAALSGRPVDLEAVRTYSALGALMLFAIMTTGLVVYAQGQTTDIRLAWTRFALPGLRQDLAVLMDW